MLKVEAMEFEPLQWTADDETLGMVLMHSKSPTGSKTVVYGVLKHPDGVQTMDALIILEHGPEKFADESDFFAQEPIILLPRAAIETMTKGWDEARRQIDKHAKPALKLVDKDDDGKRH